MEEAVAKKIEETTTVNGTTEDETLMVKGMNEEEAEHVTVTLDERRTTRTTLHAHVTDYNAQLRTPGAQPQERID